jgi:hypothetical protein
LTASAAFFRAANIITLDYPYQAAVASALSICDEACIVVGQSQDGTRDAIYAMQAQYGADRLKVREETIHYDRGWQERWWQWCAEMTTAEWQLWLDLDEVIAPEATPWLRDVMADPALFLVRFPFVHFYATPRYVKLFRLTRNTRLGRASAGYRMVNMCDDLHPTWSACAMRVGNHETRGVDAHGYRERGIVDSQWPILHYGWCRTPQALAISQAKHHAWYADGDGLADGRLPDVTPYDYWRMNEFKTGVVLPFVGEHPAGMAEWMAAHAAGWADLERVTA